MEDAEAIMRRLAENSPFLADGIEAARKRTAERAVADQMLAVSREEREQQWTKTIAALECEHDSNVAKTGNAWSNSYPDHNGRIEGELMIGKGTSLALWLDNQHCRGVLKVMPLNRTFYLDFEGLEVPVLDRLYNCHQNGEHIAFARMVNDTFVDEARSDNLKHASKEFPKRYQASTVHSSQYDTNSLVHNAFARLYWNEGIPVKVMLLDGEKVSEIVLHSYPSTKWDSPSHRGEIGSR